MAAPLRVALYGHGHMGRLHAQKLLALYENGAHGGARDGRAASGAPCGEGGPGGAPLGGTRTGPSTRFFGAPEAVGADTKPLRGLNAPPVVSIVDPAQGHSTVPERIDAAIIATPTSTHAEVALPLLERGVPCLVEKPLASTLEEARALAAYPHLMVGHIERFNPAYGVLAGVDARFVQAERVGRFTPRGTDVDVILDLMIHDLDLFLHLTGESVTEVRANGVAVATGSYDLAQARVETASGRVGTFTASRLARQPARRLRVFAEGAYWSVDLRERQAARVAWGGGELLEARVDVPARDPLADELSAFLEAASGEAPYPVTGEDGLRALELAWRIREAIRA